MKPDWMPLEMTDRHQNCVAVTLVFNPGLASSVSVNVKRLDLTRGYCAIKVLKINK
jgi:hypothetical protein